MAKPIKTSTYSAVKRKDLDRVIRIFSNTIAGYNGNEVVENIKNSTKDFEPSQGVQFDFTGQQEQQAKEMGFLSVALLVALFLITFIIVMQFVLFY